MIASGDLPLLDPEGDGVWLEKPAEIKDDNLASLLPSITAFVTAYSNLKSKQFFVKVNLTDIPLNNLTPLL